MTMFRKKPVVIEAVQFTGHNDKECLEFCPTLRDPVDKRPNLIIPTLEGEHLCSVGDWIIKGVKGEFYPCKPDIFEATYESVSATPVVAQGEMKTHEEAEIIYKQNKPYGIRDKTGFLFFFAEVEKYGGQEERYRQEIGQQFRLADRLLKSLVAQGEAANTRKLLEELLTIVEHGNRQKELPAKALEARRFLDSHSS